MNLQLAPGARRVGRRPASQAEMVALAQFFARRHFMMEREDWRGDFGRENAHVLSYEEHA
jgi:hypothetical protein